MPSVYIEPFDFKKVLVNYFLGTEELFIFAFIIIFSFVAAKYQMSNKLYLILLTVGSVLFAAFIGEAILILIFILVGFITFKALSTLMK